MSRGRKRGFNPEIPAHIDQSKIPLNCQWQPQRRFWYIRYYDETGKRRNKKIADEFATVADLHRECEVFATQEVETYKWLSDKFQKSPQFFQLSPRTQKDYEYSSKLVENYETSLGKPLGAVSLSRWDTPSVVNLIDRLGHLHGNSSANHALRYTKRLFRWGKNRGFIKDNYAAGVEELKETPDQKYVDDVTYHKVLDFAMMCGSMKQQDGGSCPSYLWAVMEIAYLCRLRGVEVVTIMEDFKASDHIVVNRRKGSRSNAVDLNNRLNRAWDALIARRDEIWRKRNVATPIHPKDRPLVVSKTGSRLKESSLQTAWQRFITYAMEKNVVSAQDRFSLHDLKRKGVTDTPGTRADKQDASGHKSDRMMDVYDKSIPRVKPAAE